MRLGGQGVGRGVRAQTVTHAETGEVFAAIPIAEWDRLVADAREQSPCPDDCGNASCIVARGLLAIDEEVRG